jgi:hypothetical protein
MKLDCHCRRTPPEETTPFRLAHPIFTVFPCAYDALRHALIDMFTLLILQERTIPQPEPSIGSRFAASRAVSSIWRSYPLNFRYS